MFRDLSIASDVSYVAAEDVERELKFPSDKSADDERRFALGMAIMSRKCNPKDSLACMAVSLVFGIDNRLAEYLETRSVEQVIAATEDAVSRIADSAYVCYDSRQDSWASLDS